MSLLKQLVNVKCDICMRAKITDGKHTGTLHTSTIPWRMFAMDITRLFIQASIKGNRYQCINIDTYSKYVWTYFIATKDEVYSGVSSTSTTHMFSVTIPLRGKIVSAISAMTAHTKRIRLVIRCLSWSLTMIVTLISPI
jgi:hypothetical protein